MDSTIRSIDNEDCQELVIKKLSEYKKALYTSLLPQNLRSSETISKKIDTLFRIKVSDIEWYYKAIKENLPTQRPVTLCINVFEDMNIASVRKFYTNEDNILIPVLSSYVYKKVYDAVRKFYTNEQEKILIEGLEKRIQSHKYYSYAKKSKHLVSSSPKLKKKIEAFLESEEGIKVSIKEYFQHNEKTNPQVSTSMSDFLIALIPFAIDRFCEDTIPMLFEYIASDREAEILSEYHAKHTIHFSDIKTLLGTEEKKIEKKQTLPQSIVPAELSVGEKTFISDIQDIFEDEELTHQLGDYLIRIFKKNTHIKIFQWFERKNIVLTDSQRMRLESLFRQYNYRESTGINENPAVETITNPKINGLLKSHTDNNIIEDISVHSIEEALSYFKNKFENIIIDEDSLMKQYHLLPLVHQHDFIASINKVIANPKLWRLQYNYAGRSSYYKISLLSAYRFALEKESGKVFLGSHAEYDTWLGR